ncbi:MarR family winged helix-turn-helix transcriptional regulator [Spirosoma rhododendri]|uniref:MarR family transcriptional regulator n=1 Tax=Spirosoma rhododendri TaxID=2728024 RepID=A0A7L5DSB8_9BACT|nr:MarR family winged helix-turn-helix transcriptional regulator [Spirosoma rhododendri]QJD79458.1 MarR family transcriptional regulator [Spirosoma rhododendri]
MEKSSAVPVLIEWERYCDEHPHGNLREFASWLLNTLDPIRETPAKPATESLPTNDASLPDALQQDDDFLSWFYMSRLNRFVRFYAKSIMAEHSFSGPDEFLFLSMIHYMDRPTKKEVCLANAVELTTGVDILRRLMKRGLILEATDERDARSKRLSLTDSGRTMVQVVGKQLEEIPHSVLADLSEADRRQFMQTLQYLNNYHLLNYKL